MQKGDHGKDGSRHRPGGMWIACGLPKPVPRSTKTTIMTVHENPIMQAAPSQRRIISIIEASNQLLFPSQKLFFVEWIWWRINISLKSCSRSKKLQPGGKPNSFAFRNPGRPRRLLNCSRDGTEAKQLHVSQSRSTETVEVTAASCEANSLRTSRARAEETAGEAAARREEDQHQMAAARDGERLDPVDNVGAFTHNCRDICPVHWLFRSGFLVDGMLPTDFSLFISSILRPDYKHIFILSW